jgi:hypothetical protein
MVRRRLRILSASVLLVLCAGIIAGSLSAMWSLPVQQDWSLFAASRGYITLSRMNHAIADRFILDGDGISFEHNGGAATRGDHGWKFDMDDRRLDTSNEAIGFFEPASTHRWLDSAGIYLFTGTAQDPGHPSTVQRILILRIPHWLIVTLASIFPLWIGGHFLLRRGRQLEGHCPSCGYDLRATPDRCPECGHEIKPLSAHDDPR